MFYLPSVVTDERNHGTAERLIQLKASRRKSIGHEMRKAGIHIISIEHLFSNTATDMHIKDVLAESFEDDGLQIKCIPPSYPSQTVR